MSPQVFLALAILALVGTPCFAAHHVPMFPSANMRMTLDGKLKVYWMYNQSMDAVWFKVVTQVTGYAAVGVSAPGAMSMNNYDMAVGGVMDDGTPYLWVSECCLILAIIANFVAYFIRFNILIYFLVTN